MRKPLIAGNWKMNLLNSKVPAYFAALDRATRMVDRTRIDMLLAVPTPFLPSAREHANASGAIIAAQTVHDQPEGAFTGEISLPMLKDLGIGWTLIGHSERRQYYLETDQLVAAKTLAALAGTVHPIVCVGETREEREGGQMQAVLTKQLSVVLGVVSKDADFTIAYEPVWAIGTGLTATDEQAEEAHAFIRGLVREKFGDFAERLRILYGGSVKSSNIQGLMKKPNVDGALIGGASLDPIEFGKIVALAASL